MSNGKETNAPGQAPSWIFINGPTLRNGKTNSGRVRSQLMRRRFWEKKNRLYAELRKNPGIQHQEERYSNINTLVCLCPDESPIRDPQSKKANSRADRVIYPKKLLSDGHLATICPNCQGVRIESGFALSAGNINQIASHKVNPFLPESNKMSRYFDQLLHHCRLILLCYVVYNSWYVAKRMNITPTRYAYPLANSTSGWVC